MRPPLQQRTSARENACQRQHSTGPAGVMVSLTASPDHPRRLCVSSAAQEWQQQGAGGVLPLPYAFVSAGRSGTIASRMTVASSAATNFDT